MAHKGYNTIDCQPQELKDGPHIDNRLVRVVVVRTTALIVIAIIQVIIIILILSVIALPHLKPNVALLLAIRKVSWTHPSTTRSSAVSLNITLAA